MDHRLPARNRGFTIVELLIVIVVVAILASVTIVSYRGIQSRARDAQRGQDVRTITKALEMYYLDNGVFPPGSGSTTLNASWSTTADSSWESLRSYLVPKYISSLPIDPQPSQNIDTRYSGYGYAYFSNSGGVYCSAGVRQMYIFTYRMENTPRQDHLVGDCPENILIYSSSSNYRVVK